MVSRLLLLHTLRSPVCSPSYADGTRDHIRRAGSYTRSPANDHARHLRHAWQALYRNLTLVDVKSVPFSLDRVVYETLTSVRDAARRLAKAHIIAYCRWDGADEDTRPKLHKAAALFLTVDFVSSRPGVVVDLEPDFAIALQIARERAYPPS